jgi:hypothetical protein
MEPLIIKETTATPKIILDYGKLIFEMTGCSRPEDVRDFYIPIIIWLEKFKNNISDDKIKAHQNSPLVFKFKFDYFNSSSAKFILDILVLINQIHLAGLNIKINWVYDENDEDMREVGEELSDVVDLPFEYIEITKKAQN